MRKLTRLEANKEVRRTLNRHGVDLSYTQYSVAGLDIRLTGWLCKTDNSDFNSSQIEGMIHEFQRILAGYSISGDFDNWNFSSDHISHIGARDKKDEEMLTIGETVTDDYDSGAG
jgi:hypothetical protein